MQNRKLRKNTNEKINKSESIKKKVVLATIIINSIAFLSIAVFLFFIITSYNSKNFDEKVVQNQNNLDQYLIKYFDGVESSINTLEGSSDIKGLKNNNVTTYVDKSDESGSLKMTPLENGDFEANLYNYFKMFLDSNKEVSSIAFAGMDNGGYMRYPSIDRKNNYDPRERPWYKDALTTDKISYTDANLTTNGDFSLAAIKRVKVDDKVIGVLNVDVSLKDLADLSQKYKNGDNGFVVILDKQGTVISNGKDSKLISKNVKDLGIEGFEEKDLNSNTKKEITIAGNKYKMYIEKSTKDNLPLTYLSFVEKSEITKSANNMMLLIGVIAIAFIIIISLVFIKMMQKLLIHINSISNNLEIIGSGDLTVQLDNEVLNLKDEIGVIARSSNSMQDSIKDMLSVVGVSSDEIQIKGQEINNTSEEIKSSANQVSLAINDVSQGALNQAEDLMDINNKLNLFSDQIDNIVTNISNLEENSKAAKDINDNNKQIMTDLLNTSNKVDKNVKNFDVMMRNLNNSISKIGDITSIINGIAEQTNLLALNAAIEASRVGDAGKGFAVVADEIRKLAEGSKNAVYEINNLITNNLQSMKELMNASEEVGDNVSNQVNIANMGVQAFYSMNEKLEEVIPKIFTINKEATNINNNKNLILEKVQDVASVAEETSASSEEIVAFSQGLEDITITMNALSTDLNHIAVDVKNGLDKFKYK
ncbi:methyl-accepting chemotaxis protein [Clostridium uliginosum]|uniref:Methyl-accepting chemotaxis protein n=1 Tax=Clostridium uliginosum TaxID=119641 RepID=A0A1I1Q587_9CLOT|nr:methyl-accepting chemotaxis protein [Clostridium uliginosum]SFD14383.1 methyl-accepting chemotaxis protein [Clostridium uliginosum]